MPKAYSTDLRWRVVWLYLVHHLDVRNIAELLSISQKTVKRYLDKFHRTGEIEPSNQQHGPTPLFGSFEEFLLYRIIVEYPGIYLHEIQEKFDTEYGFRVSDATICRTLKRMGCTRQVIHHIAIQQSDECRARFMADVSVYDPAMLVWIDESGCDRRNSIRKYGYSIRGIAPQSHTLLARGKRYNAIPIMSLQGLHDVCFLENTVDGAAFVEFVTNNLVPIINPFNGVNPLSVVIMDNASIHNVSGVRDIIENQIGARLLFLPPYSPDLNPLEEVFAQVKKIMKQNHSLFQVTSIPRILLWLAFSSVTKEDCENYIAHSGYV